MNKSDYINYLSNLEFEFYVQIIYADTSGNIIIFNETDYKIISKFQRNTGNDKYVTEGNYYFLQWSTGKVFPVSFNHNDDILMFRNLLPSEYHNYYDWNLLINDFKNN